MDLWSRLDRVERRLAESEVQVELLKEEAQARHRVNPVAPCVKIDLTQGGDRDVDIFVIQSLTLLIDDNKMTDVLSRARSPLLYTYLLAEGRGQ